MERKNYTTKLAYMLIAIALIIALVLICSPSQVAYADTCVAKIGSTEYATLADAVNAVPTDGTQTTIDIMADCEMTASVEISEGQNIVLNTNDHTITYNSTEAYAIVNMGNLVINGVSGTNEVSFNHNNYSSGDFICRDGALLNADDCEFVLDADYAAGYINNYGTLVANNVTFFTDKVYGAESEMVDGIIVGTEGRMTLNDVNSISANNGSEDESITAVWILNEVEYFEINGGHFANMSKNMDAKNGYAVTTKAVESVIEPDEIFGFRGCFSAMDGVTTINGGTYGADEFYALYLRDNDSNTQVIINDGTFNASLQTSNRFTYISKYFASEFTFVTINGGDFNGELYVESKQSNFLEVNGGNFEDGIQVGTEYNIIEAGHTILDYLGSDQVEDVTLTLSKDLELKYNIVVPESGNVTVNGNQNVTIAEDVTVILSDNSKLDVAGVNLTNNGTIMVAGDGKLVGSTVATITPKAKIGNEYYLTFEEAVNTALSAGVATITLLDDVTTESDIIATILGSNFTIDLNGHDWVIDGDVNITLGILTVENSSSTGKLIVNDEKSLTRGGLTTFNCEVENNGAITNNFSMAFNCEVENNGTIINNCVMTFNKDVVNNGTMEVIVGSEGWAEIGVYNCTLTNSGTINNGSYLYFSGDFSVVNKGDGSIVNNACVYYDEVQENEVSGAVAYYESEGYYNYFSTLQGAIEDIESGDIVVCDDIAITSSITISKDVNVVGATGDEVISSTLNNMFYIDAVCNVSFDNIGMTVANTGIKVNSAGNGATVSINNCEISSDESGAAYIVVGQTDKTIFDYYSLSFTNNTVTGQFQKPIHIMMGDNSSLVVNENTFTGQAQNGSNRSVTVIVQNDSAKVSIKNNTFTMLQKAISTDHSSATGDWTILNNKFIDVNYAFDISSANDKNVGYGLGYNYYEYDGAVSPIKILDSNGDKEYIVGDNATANITIYPYYKDSAKTTLVYEAEIGGSEVEKSAKDALSEVVVEDLTDNNGNINNDAVENATTLIDVVDKNEIAKDKELLELVNAIEQVVVDKNSTLTVENTTTISADVTENDYKIGTADNTATAPITTGLALSYFGKDISSVNAKIGVDIVQNSGDEGVIGLSMKPYVIYDGETTKNTIENFKLTAPITHRIYVGSAVTSKTVEIIHVSDNGDTSKYYVPLMSDNNENYVEFTVTHYSSFTIKNYEATSSNEFTVLTNDKTAPTISVSGTVVTVSDKNLKSVTVNGEAMQVDGSDVVIDLAQYGENSYDIVATDKYGNESVKTVTVEGEKEPTVTPPTVTPTPIPTTTTDGNSFPWWIVATVVVVVGVIGFVVVRKGKK